jgi:hypothetical protein
MEAEYFPPKEDVMLQNESPTEFYMLVSDAVVSELKPLNMLTESKEEICNKLTIKHEQNQVDRINC